jgi:hypothetical protein
MGFDVRIVPGVFAGWLVTAPALAQTWETADPASAPASSQPAASQPATSQPPAAPAAPETDAGAPVEPEFSTASSCFPACRSGFVCAQGSCVSACNPPCADGERCTPDGECVGSAAAAQPSERDTPEVESAGPAEHAPGATRERGVRTHDGFYLRLGLGFGGLGMNLDVDDRGSPGTAKASGPALLSEIALGGTIADGLVLGFGVFAGDVADDRELEFRLGGTNPYSVETRVDELTAGVVGPFLDYYFDPQRGFHIQGAVGIGVLSYQRELDREEVLLGGLGVMLGVGHEWWIGEQWSLGGLARVIWTGVGGEDPLDPELTYSGSAFVPGLLLTATYH